ncbi:MAG TPA: oligosaccharide flippase family protein, partial [Ktedonobacteraceae bacterium]|nr:oligosaccharide flippase family protein [Ktedonobacteraceae bacterium]
LVLVNVLLPRFVHGDASTTNRLILWQVALKLILSNPWIGIGLEQFPTYYARLIFSQADKLNPAGISVHNQYLELGLEGGIFWLIVGVLLLCSIVYLCWKAYKSATHPQRMLLLTTIVIIVSYLEICFADVPLDKPEGAIVLFLLAGMALGSLEQRPRFVYGPLNLGLSAQPSAIGAVQGLLKPMTGYFKAYRPAARLTLSLPTPYMRAARSARLYDGLLLEPIPGDLQITRSLPSLGRLLVPEALPQAPRTGRAVIIQLLSWAVAIPIIFPTTALLTHYLGPDQYGVYSFTIPFMTVCALFTMTGMDSWLVRQLSQQKRARWSETIGYTSGARLCTSLAISGLAALIIVFLPLSYEQRVLLLLGAGTLTFSFSYNCLRGIYEDGFVAEQQVSGISLLSTLNRIITAGLIALAVFLHLSLIWTYFLVTYSDLPFFLFLHFYTRRHFQTRLRFSLRYTWKILRESIAFTGYDALSLLSGQADMLLLLPMAGSLSVGIYALALRLTNPLISIAYIYVGSVYPVLCAGFEKGREEFSKLYHESTRILALGTIPMTIFIVVEAPAIISLLAGDTFAAAVWPTRFLMLSVALVFFSQLTLRACMAMHKERLILLISVVTLAITLLGNTVLIARWQATGASITAVLAELISLSLLLALIARQIHLWKTLGTVLLILLSNLPGLGLLLWPSHLSPLILAPAFVALTFMGYLVTRTLTRQDMLMVLQIV